MTIERRVFLATLAGGGVAAPIAATAQQTERGPRIGWLGAATRESADPYIREFQRGVTGLSYSVGSNIFSKDLELLKGAVPKQPPSSTRSSRAPSPAIFPSSNPRSSNW